MLRRAQYPRLKILEKWLFSIVPSTLPTTVKPMEVETNCFQYRHCVAMPAMSTGKFAQAAILLIEINIAAIFLKNKAFNFSSSQWHADLLWLCVKSRRHDILSLGEDVSSLHRYLGSHCDIIGSPFTATVIFSPASAAKDTRSFHWFFFAHFLPQSQAIASFRIWTILQEIYLSFSRQAAFIRIFLKSHFCIKVSKHDYISYRSVTLKLKAARNLCFVRYQWNHRLSSSGCSSGKRNSSLLKP